MPGGARAPLAEQRLPRALAAVDGGHLEVVPCRPVEVDDDRAEAEGVRDRGRQGVEQARQVLLVVDEALDVEQGTQLRAGGRLVHPCRLSAGSLPRVRPASARPGYSKRGTFCL